MNKYITLEKILKTLKSGNKILEENNLHPLTLTERLLEEYITQEGMKETPMRVKYNDLDVGYVGCADCPRCGKTVDESDTEGNWNYCPYCGQKLDWNDDINTVEEKDIDLEDVSVSDQDREFVPGSGLFSLQEPRKPVKTPPLDINIGSRRVVRSSANLFRDKPRMPHVKTVTVGGELTKTWLAFILLIQSVLLTLFLLGIL